MLWGMVGTILLTKQSLLTLRNQDTIIRRPMVGPRCELDPMLPKGNEELTDLSL